MSRRFVTRWFPPARPTLAALAVVGFAVLGLAVVPPEAAAQPLTFGSADDPREQIELVWWRRDTSLEPMLGLSLISDHWRAAGSIAFNMMTRPATARFRGTLRGGIYGDYRPDVDEPYDLVRLVEFARYNPPPRLSNVYLRAGAVDRMRLGTGHLVNFFNSATAWDERTVGVEGFRAGRFLDVAAFTDDVLVGGVVGGRAALRPFAFSDDLRLGSFEVGLNYVTDLSTRTDSTRHLTGYNVDATFDLVGWGAIVVAPYATTAWYPDYGSGIGFGAEVESQNFIDLARFRLRMGLYYDGRGFIPGYVGAFYPVSSPSARILSSEDYLAPQRVVDLEGVALEDALGGTALETELRLLVFERFEFWYYFRRHYGSQSLSEHHLRLFLRARNRVRLDVGIDRGGLLGFLSLFNDFGDQTHLVFAVDYRISGPLWVFVRSRYTYERAATAEDGTDLFLIQRRFEPYTGLRLRL